MKMQFSLRMGALALLFVTSGCTGRDEYLARGDKHFAAKEYQAALIEYRNAVDKDRGSVEARQKLSATLLALGSVEGARREAVRAADLAPDNADIQLEAARALMRTGEFQDAKTRAERVLAKNPHNATAHMLKGLATVGMNDLDSAVEDVERALQLDPRVADSYATLGALQFARGRGEEAEAALKQAIALAPDAIPPQLALANYYWRVGRREEAEQTLKGILTRHPQDDSTNRALAMFYVVNGRAPEAEAPLKAAAAGSDALEARLALADFYVGQGRLSDGIMVLEELARRPEARLAARGRLAGIEYVRGNRERAYQMVDEVLREQPKHVGVLVIKSRWLLSEGRTDEALTAAKTAVAAEPQSIAAQYLLGNVLAARQELAAAADAYNRVLEINPRAVPAQLELARLNLVRGRPENAVVFADRALKNDPRNRNARLALVKSLRARGDLAKARTELVPLIEAVPDSPTVHLEAGEIALASKDYGEATREFTKALELDASNVSAIAGLVNVEIAEHRIKAARARVDAQLARLPRNPEMLTIAGRTYAIDGDLAASERALLQAIEIDPDYMVAYHMLGQLYVRQKRLAEATSRYEEMVKRQPESVPFQTMVAMLLQVQNKTDEARKRYERILQLDSQAVVAANNLAYMKAEAGVELDVALQLAQTAKAAQPDNADVNDTLGWVYYKKDLANLAIGPLKSSVERVPGNSLYRYHLGMAYLKTGDKEKAREMLESALRLNAAFDGAADAKRALAGLGS